MIPNHNWTQPWDALQLLISTNKQIIFIHSCTFGGIFDTTTCSSMHLPADKTPIPWNAMSNCVTFRVFHIAKDVVGKITADDGIHKILVASSLIGSDLNQMIWESTDKTDQDTIDISTVGTHLLRWRHNDHAGVSNHQPHGCLLNRLFRRKSKKTSKLRATGLCVGNSWISCTNGQ